MCSNANMMACLPLSGHRMYAEPVPDRLRKRRGTLVWVGWMRGRAQRHKTLCYLARS